MTTVASDGRERLVVLRALGLGDLLTGLPALRALRAAYPEHHLTVVTPAMFAPLLESEGVADAISPSHELTPLRAELDGPDLAVDLHGRGPGSQPLLLALSPRRLIAFAHPDVPATRGGPEWRPGEHEVRRWCRLLEETGIAANPDDLSIGVPASRRADLPAAGYTVVHPGAAYESRCWPVERFVAVAQAERSAGRDVVVTGSASEEGRARRLAEAAGLESDRVWAGRTDLPTLIALVAAAGRVVCGDTGVGHLATALARPSVLLFGPVPPSEWGPPEGRRRHRALWAGRRGDPHGTVPDPGLLKISVEQVLTALDELEADANEGAAA